jgi:hypothetical protein
MWNEMSNRLSSRAIFISQAVPYLFTASMRAVASREDEGGRLKGILVRSLADEIQVRPEILEQILACSLLPVLEIRR